MQRRSKCPHCGVLLKVPSGAVACPMCGGSLAWDRRKDGFATSETKEAGVNYFRTNPPGWYTVSGEGLRVRKITKAEAKAFGSE